MQVSRRKWRNTVELRTDITNSRRGTMPSKGQARQSDQQPLPPAPPAISMRYPRPSPRQARTTHFGLHRQILLPPRKIYRLSRLGFQQLGRDPSRHRRPLRRRLAQRQADPSSGAPGRPQSPPAAPSPAADACSVLSGFGVVVAARRCAGGPPPSQLLPSATADADAPGTTRPRPARSWRPPADQGQPRTNQRLIA